ncbi:MAG TPA: Xaa-Pro peptidase family protein [Vicinamibacterales bacterium]|nr:Xaa-Pro peptidase family protein [Vicinamibacterales bacterium]
MPSRIAERLGRVRLALHDTGLDAFLVTDLTNVHYLTGFVGTAGAVLVAPSTCRLIVDFRYMTAAKEVLAGVPDVEVEVVERSYDETIVGLLQHDQALRTGIEAASMPVKRFNELSAGLARGGAGAPAGTLAPVLVPTERVVEALRVIKDADEIAALQEAGRRLSRIACRVHELVRPGRREQDIAWEIDVALRDAGFSRPAFDTIVASGPNSALPHARPTARALEAGDAVVLDFGGVYNGYCVDLTRTVQLGAPSTALRHLYEAVAAAQEAAIQAVRPGVRASAIDAAAREALASRGLGKAFGHGTGHGLGLEVHEEPRISHAVPGLRDDEIAPGMVFTIEPGAYVPGLGGVRIEDDFLVTEDGCEPLTSAPVLIEVRA